MKATNVATIKETSDYSAFKVDATNRAVTKIKKLVASMKKYGWLDAYPAHVVSENGKFIIKDGQHRFEAAKSLGIAVKFVPCKHHKDIAIPEINNAQRTWSIRDYVASWKQQGNPDYAKLVQFSESSGIGLSTCASLLSNKTPSGNRDYSNITDAIKTGKFKIRTLDFAYDVASVVSACSGFIVWAKNSLFVAAIARALRVKEISAATLIEKIKANPGLLQLMPTMDAFIVMLEDLYNYRSKKRLPLKFLAEEAVRSRAACNGNSKEEPAKS